ncbi:MAG: recombinase family protein, partial [Acutalibacteraceae bacterium]
MLSKYAKTNGFKNIKVYEDDGFTGTNFNRPDMQRLLDDVEMGYISTIIVKDMSRFGREYLQVGYYTEHYFPEKNVRFIAVNDGVDSANEEDNDFTPLRNFMNELY